MVEENVSNHMSGHILEVKPETWQLRHFQSEQSQKQPQLGSWTVSQFYRKAEIISK